MMSVFFNKPLLQSIRHIDPDAYSLAAIGKYRGIPDWVRVEYQPQLNLCVVVDEPPDLELTPSPRSPVDISTDGYAEWGLDRDVMELVGKQVVEVRNQLNLDWWNNRIQLVPFTDKYWGTRRDRELTTSLWVNGRECKAIKASGCNTECGNNQATYTWRIHNDLHNVKSHLDYKGKAFKPRNLRFKYAKKQMCNADFTWRHSLAERQQLLQERRQRLYGGSWKKGQTPNGSHKDYKTGVRYAEWKVGEEDLGCW